MFSSCNVIGTPLSITALIYIFSAAPLEHGVYVSRNAVVWNDKLIDIILTWNFYVISFIWVMPLHITILWSF